MPSALSRYHLVPAPKAYTQRRFTGRTVVAYDLDWRQFKLSAKIDTLKFALALDCETWHEARSRLDVLGANGTFVKRVRPGLFLCTVQDPTPAVVEKIVDHCGRGLLTRLDIAFDWRVAAAKDFTPKQQRELLFRAYRALRKHWNPQGRRWNAKNRYVYNTYSAPFASRATLYFKDGVRRSYRGRSRYVGLPRKDWSARMEMRLHRNDLSKLGIYALDDLFELPTRALSDGWLRFDMPSLPNDSFQRVIDLFRLRHFGPAAVSKVASHRYLKERSRDALRGLARKFSGRKTRLSR